MQLHEPLKTSAVSVLGRINTYGHAPLRVVASNYNPYIVKNARGKKPAQALIGELICSYLLKVWNVVTPEIALVTVSQDLLRNIDCSDEYHKARYYENCCFGSQVVEDAIDLNQFTQLKSKRSYAEFLNPLDFLKIGLFDLWIENHDRHGGNMNLIVQSTRAGNIVHAIDHAQVFQAGCIEVLDPDHGIMVSKNVSLLSSELCKNIYQRIRNKRNFIRNVHETFITCVRDSISALPVISSFIPDEFGYTPELQQRVARFLSDEKRNKQVLSIFSEFIRK